MRSFVRIALLPIVLAAAPSLRAEPGELAAHVEALCDPAWEGRGVGSEGLAEAGRYVETQLLAAGARSPEGGARLAVSGPDGEELFNVVALWPGTLPVEEAGAVLIGAHYDGQGRGLPGDGHPGVLHPSADDNASGVAMLLELARRFAGGEWPRPERTLIFVAFTGEEHGLLGSRAYADAPVVPLAHTRLMLNLDTVGRLGEGRLTVFGTGSAESLERVLQGVNYAHRLPLEAVAESVQGSDDASFRGRGVPTLHFFTGAHADYHRPGDRPEKLDLEGMQRIVEFVAELLDYLGRADTELRYLPPGVEQARPDPARQTQARRRVSFGSIPDFAFQGEGVRLSGVLPESPAARAGLLEGDVIVQFGESPVGDLTDYSEAMKRHAPGDEVEVVYRRGDERRSCRVTLVERR